MISIILPSIRPNLIEEQLRSIQAAGHSVDYEVIVVAPYLCPWTNLSEKIKWIYQERKGVVAANIEGYKNAQGEYIMTTSDEATLYPMALYSLQLFCKRLDDRVLTSPTHIPYFGFYYYKKWFAPFPFAHRNLIDDCGGLFLPEYKCFYADPDLSLRAYEKGYLVKECPDAVIHHPNDMGCLMHKQNVSEYTEADRLTFKKRWAHLGEFKDP